MAAVSPAWCGAKATSGPKRGRIEGGGGLGADTERFRRFTYDELIARGKASLDIFWLRDETLEDGDNLPTLGVIASEIVEDLEAALVEFAGLAESLQWVGEQYD